MDGSSQELHTSESKPRKQYGWPQFILSIVLYVVMTFALTFVVLIAQLVKQPDNFDHILEHLSTGSIALFLDALAFLIIFLIYRPMRRFLKPLFDSTVLKVPRTYLYILVAFVLIWVMQYLVLEVIDIENANQQQTDLGITSATTLLQQWLLFIAIALVTPIKEEMIFRGILYGFFTKKFNFWVGLIVSSLIFGSLHGGLIITASLMGLIIALLYRKTQSIYPPIILHMLWNAFASVSLFN